MFQIIINPLIRGDYLYPVASVYPYDLIMEQYFEHYAKQNHDNTRIHSDTIFTRCRIINSEWKFYIECPTTLLGFSDTVNNIYLVVFIALNV